MKVWIDLANSPHPLLFAPVCRRLEAEGASVAITVRDHAQTRELARERWSTFTVIGGPSPAGRLDKARAIGARVRGLVVWARAEQPNVALSHNSYAQILAARACGVAAVTAMDYEHQPANHIAFRAASRILLPEAVPAEVVARQGARTRKVVRYPGLKEELYLRDFVPDDDVLRVLGIADRPTNVAVARAAPAGAAYHPTDNPLFLDTLRLLGRRDETITVVLARHPAQRRAIEGLRLPGLLLPGSVVDARSLLHAADLFVGAGGTMTREAALLGTPTYSIFAGRPPAVDLCLERRGLLKRLNAVEQLGAIGPRESGSVPNAELATNGLAIEDAFVEATLTAGGAGRI